MLKDTLRYELPAEGNTLLGYIVRRMHKTSWLAAVAALVSSGETSRALAHIAAYCIAASTSFGRAFYQPRFNAPGDVVSEPDPQTGAVVSAKLDAREPRYRISYSVQMQDGGRFSGNEEITGTTIGLRGLGMPAPSRFVFESGEYRAELSGVLTSELVLSIIGRTRIRAYGFLNFSDNAGNSGKASVARDGSVELQVNSQVVKLTEPITGGS